MNQLLLWKIFLQSPPSFQLKLKISQTDKIRQNSIIFLEQARVINKTRLKQFLGRLNSKKL